MGRDAKPGHRTSRGVPWLGLLLWIFACAALFVSLIMRDDHHLDRDRRVAARSEAAGHTLELPYATHPMRQADGLGVYTTRPPSSY